MTFLCARKYVTTFTPTRQKHYVPCNEIHERGNSDKGTFRIPIFTQIGSRLYVQSTDTNFRHVSKKKAWISLSRILGFCDRAS